MKKLLFTVLFLSITMASAYAQRFAFVDTEYILDNIPEYRSAQEELDELSVQWQKEIEAMYQEIEQMYQAYQAEAVLLPEEMKVQKQNEIIAKEKEVKDLQKKRFGTDGDLFKKREELIKPIQDKVYNAIEEIAKEGNYAFILDKSSGASVLYLDVKYDKSDEVLNKLGYRAGAISN
jgi:outer membrane protein